MFATEKLPATPGVIPPIGWILVREMSSGSDFWVDPNSLELSPPTSILSVQQVERIKRIASCLQEHDTTPADQWIENMRRDRHPENEIRVWEEIIECYQEELKERSSADIQERHLIYTALLTASMLSIELCNVENVLSSQPAAKRLPKLEQVIVRYNQKRNQ